jgi:hypothetical protein
MANLNRLTIPYLKKLAEECNIKLKNGRKSDLISQIEKAGINESRLESLIEKYLKEKQKNKIKKKKKQLNLFQLEERVNALELKIDLIYNKFVKEERKFSDRKNTVIHEGMKTKSKLEKTEESSEKKLKLETPTSVEKIKEFIIKYFEPGEKITVDNLFKLKQLQNIPLSLIKDSISQLIEENVLQPSREGSSIQKINGSISILIRK